MRGELKAIWEFLVHTVVAVCIFVIVSLPAVGLNLLVEWLSNVTWLSHYHIGQPIIVGVEVLEYVIFAGDAILFILFMGRSVYVTAKKLVE